MAAADEKEVKPVDEKEVDDNDEGKDAAKDKKKKKKNTKKPAADGTQEDVEEVDNLFHDGKASAKLLEKNKDKYIIS